MSTDSVVSKARRPTSRRPRPKVTPGVEPAQNDQRSEAGATIGQSLAPHPFAHPSEAEFAKILDFYGLRWEYEPRSFRLRWEEDRVLEMFTPDFYLPDLDMYVELTTLKQSLVTEKNPSFGTSGSFIRT